jgi:hypothetical protein
VGLRVVDGGVNDHIDGHARCLLLGVRDASTTICLNSAIFLASTPSVHSLRWVVHILSWASALGHLMITKRLATGYVSLY